MPEEKLTKGGFGFSGQLLYGVAGKIISLGVEAGYLRFWKDEYNPGTKVEESLSAIPILGIIQLEAPLPSVSPYLQVGAGVYPLTAKMVISGIVIKDTETEFGIMAAAGVAIPLAPKLNLDVGGKLHMLFAEDESTIILNPVAGISIRF